MKRKTFIERSRKRHVELKKNPKQSPINKKTGFSLVIIFLALALFEFYSNNSVMTTWFWIYFALGALIFLPTVLLSFFKFSIPVIPYFATIVKTKKFIELIKRISRFGKLWEKICILGVFMGFGLAGVDYWSARKLSFLKRILVLAISAGILYLFGSFVAFAIFGPIFSIEILKPLALPMVIGFVLLGFGGFTFAILLGYGFISLGSIFTGVQLCPNVAPVLPGVPIPGLGVVIPLVGWISLGIILVVHEASHGLMLSYYMRKIKSVGLFLVGIFPMGAFVEESQKSFESLPDRKKLLILSAGSAMNLVIVPIAFVAMLLFSIIFVAPFSAQLGALPISMKVSAVDQNVSFCGVTKQSPSYGKLLPGDQILSVNGIELKKYSDLNEDSFKDKNVSLGILRDGNNLAINLSPIVFENIGIKKIGASFEVTATGAPLPFGYSLLSNFYQSILWILLLLWLLSFAVGSFNYIPVSIFDGGRMSKIILLPYFGFLKMSKDDTERFIGRLFLWLFIGALLLNLIPYFTMVF
ncbi:MAG: site-2 protease family protein [archaeon]|jgi:membrane-associated protease RseP (regulator of RpoE activity)